MSEAFKVLETGQFDAFTLLPYWQQLNELRLAAEVSESVAAARIGDAEAGAAAALEALEAAEQFETKQKTERILDRMASHCRNDEADQEALAA